MSKIQSLRAEQSRAEQRLGCLNGFGGGSFAGQVYEKNGLAPTLTDMQGGGRQPHIVETQRIICAMRGRNKENPFDRTPGIELEQRLELQEDGICNTLTSVQKDNMVLETQTIIYDDYNFVIPEDQNATPTLTTNCGASATRNGVKVIEVERNIDGKWFDFVYSEGEIYERNPNKILRILWEEVGEEEISEWEIRGLWCILAKEVLRQNMYAKRIFENWKERPDIFQCSYFCQDNQSAFLTDKYLRDMWQEWTARCASYRRGLAEQYTREFDGFMQKLSFETASSKEIVCYMWKTAKRSGLLFDALTQIQKIWQSLYDMGEDYYLIRIRKLTPKCCWRLMGFTDEDFEKAEEVCSNTRLYAQAGNSICVPVLEGIFKSMLE